MKIEDLGVILSATENSFESRAVLNPACIAEGGIVHMFYRAINQDNISTIGYSQLKDNKVIQRDNTPFIFPEHDFERGGVEDPRIVYLEGLYYLFYTAFNGRDASAAYAVSPDLRNFEKRGEIFPRISNKEASIIFREANLPEKYEWFAKHYIAERGEDSAIWEKDVFILPEKIGGDYFLIHRIMPGIQAIRSGAFWEIGEEFWKKYLSDITRFTILDPSYDFENYRIGGGAPPIKTGAGWLLIYHSIEKTNHGRIYHASAALLDLQNPFRVIAKLPYPLFSPEAEDERNGLVADVVFPTGTVVQNDDLFIYYGAADTRIKAKRLSLVELIGELLKNRV